MPFEPFLVLAACVASLVGGPALWRSRQPVVPARSHAFRVVALASVATWLVLVLSDLPSLSIRDVRVAAVDSFILVLPLILVFLAPATLTLASENWKFSYSFWSGVALAIGVPVGLLSGILIGCSVQGGACL